MCTVCPKGAPVKCPSGECRAVINQCGSSTPVPANVDRKCPKAAPTVCFDGSCKKTYADCQNWQNALLGGSGSSADTVIVCTGTDVLCPNGACARSAFECDITAACPWDRPYRCWNGECVADKATTDTDFACVAPEVECPIIDQATNTKAVRCEDGSCRASCFQYDGCPLKMFGCANGECAKTSDDCKAAEKFDESLALIPSQTSRRLLADMTGFLQPNYANLTTPHACFMGCNRQIKATFQEITVDSAKTTEVSFAVNDVFLVTASMVIPSGSLISRSGLFSPTLTIRPLGDSYLRRFVNRVTASRRDATNPKYLTYPNSVLSTAFQCVVNDDTVEPFPIPITVQAIIDLDKKPVYADVCLAYEYKIPDVDFRAWKCVEKTDDLRLNNPVRTLGTNQTESLGTVKGNVNACNGVTGTVYAFAYIPMRVPQPPEEDKVRWWADNLIWIVLVFCAVGGIISGVFYVFKRLHRYRKKYKETDKQVKEMEQEVDEMEQFGGTAGQKDEALEMMSNPMVVQMKDMQAKLDRKNKEVIAEEEKDRKNRSEARQDHIGKLQDDRDKLQRELDELKAQLETSSKGRVEPAAAPVSPVTRQGSKRDKGTGATSSAPVRAKIDAKPPAPRKKKKEVD